MIYFFSLENNFYSLHQREKDRNLPKSNMNTQQCEGKKSHSSIVYIHHAFLDQKPLRRKNIAPPPFSKNIYFAKLSFLGPCSLLTCLNIFEYDPAVLLIPQNNKVIRRYNHWLKKQNKCFIIIPSQNVLFTFVLQNFRETSS